MERRNLVFSVKSLSETGAFTGLAATYGNVDLGGDVIERGAFTKTIEERGSEVVLLYQHDSRESIGLGRLEDSEEGLVVHGQLELDLPEAKHAYARLKRRLLKGLSIGFRVPKGKAKIKEGIRYIKEIILDEISLVTFPMNEQAKVLAVKSRDVKLDFATAMEARQTWSARHESLMALSESLDSIVWDGEMSEEQKLDAAERSIDQFRAAYLDILPGLFALMASEFRGLIATDELKLRGERANKFIASTALPGDGGAASGTLAGEEAATSKGAEPIIDHSMLQRFAESISKELQSA